MNNFSMKNKSLGKSSWCKRASMPIAFLAIVALGAAPARDGDKLEFNRDIRPILAENCFACHGPDKAARKADLRLDRREEALKAEAIVPGKPDKSLLVERIFADDPSQRMPPAKTKKTLAPAEKEILRRWIAAGAEYQPHWSLIPPKRPPLPRVKDLSWVRNPIASSWPGWKNVGWHPRPKPTGVRSPGV